MPQNQRALKSVVFMCVCAVAFWISPVIAQTPNTSWYNNTATSFTISTAEQLAGLAEIVNGTWGGSPWRDNFSGKTVTLAVDINLSQYPNWVPIGDFSSNENNIFSGVFNGGGNTIRNLTINRTANNQGLFGRINAGRVENLQLQNLNINGGGTVGGLAGLITRSRVININSTGTISGGSGIGGLVGSASDSSSVTDSYSSSTIRGSSSVGGVVGSFGSNCNTCNVTNVYSTGAITGTSTGSGIGGVLGSAGSIGLVTNSYSTGAISGGSTIGGVVGNLSGGNVTNSYSTGAISGGNTIGGVVGNFSGSNVTNSYSTGTIRGGSTIGGVVGSISGSNARVTRSYSNGAIIGTGSVVGGVAGSIRSSSNVTNSFSSGTVVGQSSVGGVAGSLSDRGSVNNSYSTAAYVGRVVGDISNAVRDTLSNNVGYTGTRNSSGNISWPNNTATARDGANITLAAIQTNSTIGNRFTSANGWTLSNGRLPGIGEPVEFPMAISPAYVRTGRGKTLSFTATSWGESIGRSATWTVYGNSSSATTINFSGSLFVAPADTARWLLVTASSSGQTAMAVINVIVPDTLWYTANTEAASFTISTPDELAGLAAIVNAGTDNFSGKTITLAGNMDMSQYNYENWTPIGNSSVRPFSGTFNGGNNTISRLNQSLFGHISNGRVENLVLTNLNLNLSGGGGAGAVAGTIVRSNLINISSSGTISGGSGIAGSISDNSSITNSHSNGTISGGSGIVGYVSNSNVINSYSTGTVNGENSIGGVVGLVFGGSVNNCYSTGAVTGTGSGVGGVAGSISSSSNVTNSFSSGTVVGQSSVGGVVGLVAGGSVNNCYSTGAVTGTGSGVGGVVGVVSGGSIVGCAALNPEVKGTNFVGRVTGSFSNVTLLNNIAYSEMRNNDNNNTWENKGASDLDGEDITASTINADITIGNRFTAAGGWATGTTWSLNLGGTTVRLPTLLNVQHVSILLHDRVIPQNNTNNETVIITPANMLTSEFTAGPNPTNRNIGTVNFFRQGKRIENANLSIYDASGNFVKKIKISDKAFGSSARRQVGSWDLTDRRRRLVSEGTYLVRGVITASDGKRERVSVMVGVQ